MRLAVYLALAAALAGCYGRATPENCHKKFIRDQRGGPDEYEECLARYERRLQIVDERRRGLRPSRGQIAMRIIGAVASVAAANRGHQPAVSFEPFGWHVVCLDGWVSPCIAAWDSNQGCCAYHVSIDRSRTPLWTNQPGTYVW